MRLFVQETHFFDGTRDAHVLCMDTDVKSFFFGIHSSIAQMGFGHIQTF
jgi:hypothetical protein